MSAPAASRSEIVFRARSLTKIDGMGDGAALASADLDLYRGELVVPLGPSGSGKSTRLNILGGLDTPTSGQVTFVGHDLTLDDGAARTKFRREHVGFVFQFYNVIPSLTARENVALVTEIARHPMAPEQALARVEARIVVWEAHDVRSVPVRFRCGTGWCIFVVEGGRGRRRELDPAHRSSAEVETPHGLRSGDELPSPDGPHRGRRPGHGVLSYA
jgi:ABC-type sugar transport system ATPase subunit